MNWNYCRVYQYHVFLLIDVCGLFVLLPFTHSRMSIKVYGGRVFTKEPKLELWEPTYIHN